MFPHAFHIQVSEQLCKAEQQEEPKTLQGQVLGLKIDVNTAEELLAAGWQPPLPGEAEQLDQAPLPDEIPLPDQALLPDETALPNQAPLPDEIPLPDQTHLNSADMDVGTPQTPPWRPKSSLDRVPSPLPLPQVASAFRPIFWCNQDSADDSVSTVEDGAITAPVQARAEPEMLLPPHLRSPDACAKVIRGSLSQQSQPMLLAEDARRPCWMPTEPQTHQQQGLPGAEPNQGRGHAQQPPRPEPPGLSLRHFLPDQPVSPRRHSPGPQQGERMHPAASTQEPAASHPVTQRPHATHHPGEPHAAPFRHLAGPAVDQQAHSAVQSHPFMGPRAQPVRPSHPRLTPHGLAVPTRGLPRGEQGAMHGLGYPAHVSHVSAQSLPGANGHPAQDRNRFAGLYKAPSGMRSCEQIEPQCVDPLIQHRDNRVVMAGPYHAINPLADPCNTASLAGQPADQPQRECERLRAEGPLNRPAAQNYRQQTDQLVDRTAELKRKQEEQQRDEASARRRMQRSPPPRAHADERVDKRAQSRKCSRSVDERISSNHMTSDRAKQRACLPHERASTQHAPNVRVTRRSSHDSSPPRQALEHHRPRDIRLRAEHCLVNQRTRQSQSQERGASAARSDVGGHDRIRSRGPSHDRDREARGWQSPPAGAGTPSAARVRRCSADLSPRDRIRAHSASQNRGASRDCSPHDRTRKPGYPFQREAGRERGSDKQRSLSQSARDRSPGSTFRDPGPSRHSEFGREHRRERSGSRSLEKGSGTAGTLHGNRSHQRAFQGDREDAKHTVDHTLKQRSHSREQRSSRDGNLGNGGPASWSREARATDWCPGDTFDHTPGEIPSLSALARLGALGHLRSD